MEFPIITKLGGFEAVLAILEARRGKRPSHFSLRKWSRERKMPAVICMTLMEECRARGIACDVTECQLPAVLPRGRPWPVRPKATVVAPGRASKGKTEAKPRGRAAAPRKRGRK